MKQIALVLALAVVAVVATCPTQEPYPNSECSDAYADCDYSACPDDISQSYPRPWNSRCYCLLVGQSQYNSQNVDLWKFPLTNRAVFSYRWVCVTANCTCPASVQDNSDCDASLSAGSGLPNTYRAPYRVGGQTGCRYAATMRDGTPGEKVCKCRMYNGNAWIWQCRYQHK